MEKQELLEKLKEKFTETEFAIFEGMLHGDNIKQTSEDFALSITEAQAQRRIVYEVLEDYANLKTSFGSKKQPALIQWWNSLPGQENVADAGDLPDEKEQTIKELKDKIFYLTQDNQIYKEALQNKTFSGQFFVFNPSHGQPRKVYNSYEKALEDAKSVAQKNLQNVFVLQILTLCIPHVEIDVVDKTIADPNLIGEDEIPF